MIRFDVMYYSKGKFSHSYAEGWEPTAYFCPHCGKQSVWMETSGGDYYVGEDHLCADCGANFNLPGGADPRPDNDQDKQRLVAIRHSRSAAPRSDKETHG